MHFIDFLKALILLPSAFSPFYVFKLQLFYFVILAS